MANSWRAAGVNRTIVVAVVSTVVAAGVAFAIGLTRSPEENVASLAADIESLDVSNLPRELLDPAALPDLVRPTVPTRLEALSAAELGLELDPDGRPFDRPASVLLSTSEVLGPIVLPDSSVTAVDGLSLITGEEAFIGTPSIVQLDGATEAEVTVLWKLSSDPESSERDEIAGARLDVEGRSVDQWEAVSPDRVGFSIGGLTSGRELSPDGTGEGGNLTAFRDHVHFGDHDDQPGDDTLIVFGSENAEFDPYIGFAADGTVASVLVFDDFFSWRLSVFDGTPPEEVTAREDQLLECIAGVRPVTETNNCVLGEN